MKRSVKKFFKKSPLKQNYKYNIRILGNVAKAVLRGKFIVTNTYLKKWEKSQINNLTLYLKEVEKEEQMKPKSNRNKEVT